MTISETLPTDRAELQRHTIDQWNRFVAFTDTLADPQWTGPVDSAGWTVKDHVAHVTAWDQSLIELLRNGTPRQRTLRVSDAAWPGGYDPINEEIRQQTATQSIDEVKLRRDRIFVDVVTLLEGYSDGDLAAPATTFGLQAGDESLLEKLVDDLGVHYGQHLRYIQAIVASETRDGG